MMKSIAISAIHIGALFAVPGCKKKDTTPPVTPMVDSSFLKASVNGTPLSFSGDTLAYASTSSSSGINYIYIYGASSTGRAIRIALVNLQGPGTVALATGDGYAEYYTSGGLFGTYSYASSGSEKIPELYHSLQSSFSFTTADNTVITGGSFQVVAP